MQHLQRQLAQREAEVEQMAALKKQEGELKQQVEQLQEKLREAKRAHAPVSFCVSGWVRACLRVRTCL